VKHPLSIVLALALLMGVVGNTSAQLSVSISDNVIVLDDKKRTGSIELLNLGLDPVEFTVRTIENSDDNALIRWAPARVLVQPNSSARLRVLARPNAKITTDEVLIKLGITSEVRRPPRTVAQERTDERISDGIEVTVPIVPTLPMFVYFRSQGLVTPVTLGEFVATPDDSRLVGYFPVTKPDANKSFVGQARIINKENGQIIDQGRLHLTYGAERTNVQVLRTNSTSDTVLQCLQLWNQFPGQGDPAHTVCR
jgi:hypothetical protein